MESHPLTLDIDDKTNPSIVWVRPMTERDAAKVRAAGRGKDGEDLTAPSVFDSLLGQISKIENVRWAGVCPFATDDPATIRDIMIAWPITTRKAWAIKIFGFCTLDEAHAKNSDGSSALLDTGSPLVVRASIDGASVGQASSSESRGSETAPNSQSAQ